MSDVKNGDELPVRIHPPPNEMDARNLDNTSGHNVDLAKDFEVDFDLVKTPRQPKMGASFNIVMKIKVPRPVLVGEENDQPTNQPSETHD